MAIAPTPEMFDELLRVTTPAQPRLDYDTLRARYEWLLSNMHRFKAQILLHTDGRAEAQSFQLADPQCWPQRSFKLDPAQMDALVAEAMKGQDRG